MSVVDIIIGINFVIKEISSIVDDVRESCDLIKKLNAKLQRVGGLLSEKEFYTNDMTVEIFKQFIEAVNKIKEDIEEYTKEDEKVKDKIFSFWRKIFLRKTFMRTFLNHMESINTFIEELTKFFALKGHAMQINKVLEERLLERKDRELMATAIKKESSDAMSALVQINAFVDLGGELPESIKSEYERQWTDRNHDLMDGRDLDQNIEQILDQRIQNIIRISNGNKDKKIKSRDRVEDESKLRFEQNLGQGRFGTVVKMINELTGDIYAVKLINLEKAALNGIQINDIDREARILRSINHVNIVRLYQDLIDSNKRNYLLLMELCVGRDLQSYITPDNISSEQLFSWLQQLISGVVYIHHERILHRDLKPENIRILYDGSLKIVDFGVSCRLEEFDSVKQNVGTEYYSSDEKYSNQEYDGRDDVWAVGCIFLELVNGERIRSRVSDPNNELYLRQLLGNCDIRNPAVTKIIQLCLTIPYLSRPSSPEILLEVESIRGKNHLFNQVIAEKDRQIDELSQNLNQMEGNSIQLERTLLMMSTNFNKKEMELHESILRYDNLAMQRAEMEDIFQNIITQKDALAADLSRKYEELLEENRLVVTRLSNKDAEVNALYERIHYLTSQKTIAENSLIEKEQRLEAFKIGSETSRKESIEVASSLKAQLKDLLLQNLDLRSQLNRFQEGTIPLMAMDQDRSVSKKSVQEPKIIVKPKDISSPTAAGLSSPSARDMRMPANHEDYEELSKAVARNDVPTMINIFGKVDINANQYRDKEGHTLLHMASNHGYIEAIRLLLSHGAEMNSRDNNGWSPLHGASYEGHEDAVEFLIVNGADVHAFDKMEQTPLHAASCRGHAACIKDLLTNKANIHAVDIVKQTALHIASANNHVDVMRILLNQGMSVDAKDQKEWTPLHCASSRGSLRAVEYLLQHHADIHARDKDRWTPLHAASSFGHVPTIQYLVNHGADIHAELNNGNTPFIVACKLHRFDAVKYLIEKKSKLYNVNEEGKHGLMYLTDKQREALKPLIKRASP